MMRRKAVAQIGIPAILVTLTFCVGAHADAAVERLLPRFADSAVQGFESRMMDSAIQRFDSQMKNSTVQGFESRMMSSPVSRFNSRMRPTSIQYFDSLMMYSPAQTVQRPTKPFRPLTFFFAPIHRITPATVHEADHVPTLPDHPTASPLFISLRCGTFTEITVGKSEILSENEEAPCGHSGEDSTDRDETSHLNDGRY
jgi:hypothetical protein